MIAYLLTEQQKNEIVGQQFASNSYFNPIQDDKDNWVIFEEEVRGCVNEDFMWVENLPTIEYVPPLPPSIL
jgi:hypothetical protein